jgi:hypothetical protein
VHNAGTSRLRGSRILAIDRRNVLRRTGEPRKREYSTMTQSQMVRRDDLRRTGTWGALAARCSRNQSDATELQVTHCRHVPPLSKPRIIASTCPTRELLSTVSHAAPKRSMHNYPLRRRVIATLDIESTKCCCARTRHATSRFAPPPIFALLATALLLQAARCARWQRPSPQCKRLRLLASLDLATAP